MKTLAILLLLLTSSGDDPVSERLNGYPEINHFYDYQGKWVFDQMLFWEWDAELETFCVKEWRLISNARKVLPKDSQEYKDRLEMIENEIKKANGWKEWPADLPIPYEDEWIGLLNSNMSLDQSKKTVRFIDNGKHFRVITYWGEVKESWTDFDPELVDRSIRPKEKRVPFVVPQVRKK